MTSTPFLSLSDDLLLDLVDYIHNIEDLINLSSTCTRLRDTIGSAGPKQVLRLAAAQSSTFFRPSPHFLVAATARELGHWARLSDANEKELAFTLDRGIHGLMDLALANCGLTLERIRHLRLMRFSIINPVADIIDKCVGEQWLSLPNFWYGGVSDAGTIHAEVSETLLHLAIYGELFGPDFDAYLNQDTHIQRLKVDTRLEFIKYCVPDLQLTSGFHAQNMDNIDPRRILKMTGPYENSNYSGWHLPSDDHTALVHTLQSSRWLPHWKKAREQAGPDFSEDHTRDFFHWQEDGRHWKQRMWEAVMLCQGLEGLGMICPDLRESWTPKIKEWREKIASLEQEPGLVRVKDLATLEYPYLLGDLCVIANGDLIIVEERGQAAV